MINTYLEKKSWNPRKYFFDSSSIKQLSINNAWVNSKHINWNMVFCEHARHVYSGKKLGQLWLGISSTGYVSNSARKIPVIKNELMNKSWATMAEHWRVVEVSIVDCSCCVSTWCHINYARLSARLVLMSSFLQRWQQFLSQHKMSNIIDSLMWFNAILTERIWNKHDASWRNEIKKTTCNFMNEWHF